MSFFIGSLAGVFIIVLINTMLAKYPAVRALVGDLYFILNRISLGCFRFLRKKAVELKYTSYIDKMRKSFNDDSMDNLLSKCSIKWVPLDSAEGYSEDNGNAIVCVHIDKRFHDNMFNALNYYVSKDLLRHSDPYMHEHTLSAIRLMGLKKIVVKQHILLNKFNNLFLNQAEEVRSVVRKMQEVDRCGLFNKILLPGLSLWTDKVITQLPGEYHKNEAESFIEWLYFNSKVNTSEDEHFRFSFESSNVKLALIVIANDEYFAERSYLPYIRRAHSYSALRFDVFYVISLGKAQGERARKLCDFLVKDKCYQQLSKQSQAYVDDLRTNEQRLLTCIALKPNLDTMINRAWEKLISAKREKKQINGFVSDVFNNGITVNYDGLLIDIPKSRLSSVQGINHQLYFQKYNVLSLQIVDIDELKKRVKLSNIDTRTDPSVLIEKLRIRVKEKISTTVKAINVYDSIEKSVILNIPDSEIDGYLSRKNITKAPYTKISDLLSVGQPVDVMIINYDIEHNRYDCKMEIIDDPFITNRPIVNDVLDLRVMSSCESGVSCRLYNGLEGFIPVSEFSWFDRTKNRDDIQHLKINELLKAKVIDINYDKRTLIFSRKSVLPNEVEDFARVNKDCELSGIVEIERPTSLQVRHSSGILIFVPLGFDDSERLDRSKTMTGKEIKILLKRYDQIHQNCLAVII